ncbi:MAG: sigma-54 dependent transcriptional regulator [Nitrospirota bacterium]
MGGLKGKVLVVDDDREMCELIHDLLIEDGERVEITTNGKEVLPLVSDGDFDLVIIDLVMKEMNGLELFRQIKEIRPDTAVIIITAFGTIESAIEAMKLGAYDYITKPFKNEEIKLVTQKAINEISLRKEVVRLRSEVENKYRFDNIIGKSKPMQEIFDLIRRISDGPCNILITGDSGTGKELVAKAIHYNSPRKENPFIPINCAAIPENLLESELFGHIKGSFTDAKKDKTGLFEEAEGGTIFLDEISELSILLQAKLLRVIQEREIRRVGSTKNIKIDVRIIAATNLDLDEEVKKKRFREDLFYRLNVIRLNVPPLKNRRDDIPLLLEYFTQRSNERLKKTIKGIAGDTLAFLMEYTWPGNVRELENLIERAIILAKGELITMNDLPSELLGTKGRKASYEITENHMVSLDELEKAYILKVLARTGGNKFRAAEILGIDRKTLYRKLDDLKRYQPQITE